MDESSQRSKSQPCGTRPPPSEPKPNVAPPPQRRVHPAREQLALRGWEHLAMLWEADHGQTLEEIATTLGRSSEAVSRVWHRLMTGELADELPEMCRELLARLRAVYGAEPGGRVRSPQTPVVIIGQGDGRRELGPEEL